MKKIWSAITRNYLSDAKHDYTIVRLGTDSISKQITVILQLLLNAIIVPPKIFVKAFIQELFLLIISIFKTLLDFISISSINLFNVKSKLKI